MGKTTKDDYRKNNLKIKKKLTNNTLDVKELTQLFNDECKTIKNIMKNRPKNDRYQNRDSWDLAVKYAKLLSKDGNFSDNTKGATHYYNPNKIEPDWGQKRKTWISHPPKGLDHIFGRDTTTKWSKNFKGR